MTNDIEGKVRELKEILLTPIDEADKGKSFLVGWVSEKQLYKIASLITNPLDEKEVVEICKLKWKEVLHFETSDRFWEDLAHVICSHFSKPVIKYPEKKEELSRCVPKNDYNWGYNQAIDDMHKLNGEGGV